jgi:hypothetical protein
MNYLVFVFQHLCMSLNNTEHFHVVLPPAPRVNGSLSLAE